MASAPVVCSACGRDTFTSTRGLKQHQKTNKMCARQLLREKEQQNNGYITATEGLQFQMIVGQADRKRYMPDDNLTDKTGVNLANKKHKDLQLTQQLAPIYQQEGNQADNYETALEDHPYEQDDLADQGMMNYEEDDDNFYDSAEEDGRNNFAIGGLVDNELEAQKQRINIDFKAYVDNAKRNFRPFTHDEHVALKLMAILRKSKASLKTYDEVMQWHLIANGHMKDYDDLAKCPQFVQRKQLFKMLRKRYNMDKPYFSQTTRIMLPSSKTAINIVWSDAAMQIQSLLTDPRIQQKDFLFHEGGPFSPPPESLDYVCDINTGLSYTETYKRLIKDPSRQVLLPVCMYLDGAVTGQFSNLPITAFRIALGIYTMWARNQDHFWRNIGYIPKVAAEMSRGRRMMLESLHGDGLMQHQDVLHGEGVPNQKKVKPIQDYHAMLGAVLKTFEELQRTGIKFDWMYDGKMYPNTEFIPFIPHIKADNEEADKLAGKYGSRSGNVQSLCRYCTYPTNLTDKCLLNHRRKTVPMIKALVKNKDKKGLKVLSQHEFLNVFWHLRFGLHNKAGIHGALPIDMLHTVLLGTFKRSTECFFDQLGKTSKTAEAVNDLSKEYGELLDRQSDRNMPKTKFSTGVLHGKIMGKEHEGILLCLATVLYSSLGKQILAGHHGRFGEKDDGSEKNIRDWLQVIGLLLGWLQWLKSPKLLKVHIEAARIKHRNLMHMVKKTFRRAKGMGMKIPKFHLILHICDDILYFGIPAALDTGTNESHHKLTKKDALVTQKQEKTFVYQTSVRGEEMLLLAYAGEELDGRPLWEYYDGHYHPSPKEPPAPEPHTGGSSYILHYEEDTDTVSLVSKRKVKDARGLYIETDFVEYVDVLQDKVYDYVPEIQVRTEHKREGEIFRAHTQCYGGIWRDWVLVDWSDEVDNCARLWGFVDLSKLPENSGINFAGYSNLQPGVYAICEYAEYEVDADANMLHNLFVPLRKQVGRIVNDSVTKLKFYLVDVETFVGPVTVVPDVGGQPNSYIMVKNRAEWLDDFHDWLLNEDVPGVTVSDDESSYNGDTDDEVSVSETDDDDKSDVSGENNHDFDRCSSDSESDGSKE